MTLVGILTRHPARPWALLSSALAVAALAQVAPTSAPLQLAGNGPYYQLTLPATLFTLTRSPELSDLRVRNANGAALPWAWQNTELPTPGTRQQSVPLFPVPFQSTGDSTQALSLRIRADGSLEWKKQTQQDIKRRDSDWIVDAHAAPGNLLRLRLTLAQQANGLFPLSVEGSDDLSHWQMLASGVAVLQLNHQGQTLRQDQIDLGSARARYLRLRWQQPDQAPGLQAAEVESFEQAVPPAATMQWTESWAPQQCDDSACTWQLPAGLPVDAVRLRLAEANTVAQLRILGESIEPMSGSAPVTYSSHHPLHGLRHRDRAPTPTRGDGMQRTLLADTVVWRLAPDGQTENETPALMLDGSRPTRLRIEAQHVIREWGSTPPRIAIGTRSRTLSFLVRGPGPFTLNWGGTEPEGAAVSLSTLMPAGSLGALGEARVDLPAIAQPAGRAVVAASAAAAAVNPQPTDHKPWLWAALVAGLLILGAMATSLLKQIKPKT